MSDLKFSGDKSICVGAKTKSASRAIKSSSSSWDVPPPTSRFGCSNGLTWSCILGKRNEQNPCCQFAERNTLARNGKPACPSRSPIGSAGPSRHPAKRTYQTGAKAATILHQHLSDAVNLWFSLELIAPNFNGFWWPALNSLQYVKLLSAAFGRSEENPRQMKWLFLAQRVLGPTSMAISWKFWPAASTMSPRRKIGQKGSVLVLYLQPLR